MTAEQRSVSASIAARARWGIKGEVLQTKSKSEAAKKLAILLEQNMNDMGLTEAEKQEKFQEMVEYIKERSKVGVDRAKASKLAQTMGVRA